MTACPQGALEVPFGGRASPASAAVAVADEYCGRHRQAMLPTAILNYQIKQNTTWMQGQVCVFYSIGPLFFLDSPFQI